MVNKIGIVSLSSGILGESFIKHELEKGKERLNNLVGKPQNETYYDEYKKILSKELTDKDLSIVYNLNVGHATPR